MRIDAHQHLWYFDPVSDSWIDESMIVLRRDFLPRDLKPHLDAHDIQGSVVVQADQSEAETDFLLSAAEQNPWIKGVVGWVNLISPDLPDRLDHFQKNSLFKGVRHIIQAEKSGFMKQPRFIHGLKTIAGRELSFDLLIKENQLHEALELARSLPEMKLVIDHIAKPDISHRSFNHWAQTMTSFSEMDHVFVKLSGMSTEADWSDWSEADLMPYVDFCLETFGAGRLMYGSDWPVCLLAGSYEHTITALEHLIQKLSVAEQQQIMGLTAMNFYNLT